MMLSISDNAKEYLSNALSESGKKYATLNVKGGGCSGFKYEWGFADDPENFPVLEDLLVVDPMAEMFLFGCTVDYVRELGGSYLTVKNPNATASCGCGESFAV